MCLSFLRLGWRGSVGVDVVFALFWFDDLDTRALILLLLELLLEVVEPHHVPVVVDYHVYHLLVVLQNIIGVDGVVHRAVCGFESKHCIVVEVFKGGRLDDAVELERELCCEGFLVLFYEEDLGDFGLERFLAAVQMV